MEHSMQIQYDKIDNIVIAIIPELPGCIAHGDTQEAALKEIRVVAEMFIDDRSEIHDFVDASMSSTGFWDNPDDEVWDEV